MPYIKENITLKYFSSKSTVQIILDFIISPCRVHGHIYHVCVTIKTFDTSVNWLCELF